ncbi:MAG: fumarylacetoacetate hydrolase family protein [Rhodospirillaceae bacterium]|nr:fumarylacetoacetate hydrolase family protein [Rhodospirillaceae bacterium]
MALELTIEGCLPTDWRQATLVGRAWLPGQNAGPAIVTVRGDALVDITGTMATMSDLMNAEDPLALARSAPGEEIGSLAEILANSAHDAQDPQRPSLLAPNDLQAIKAAGVTFAVSMLERVIEEQAKGDPKAADEIRGTISESIGTDLSEIVPGSEGAERLKALLIERGLWSQYLEVGIGPEAEVFTKSQPMSAVGVGAEVGVTEKSTWNNPEPEVVVVVNARGEITGATLGNDVNLRDVEGRSALLLGKAKDNNGSAAVGPLIRLLDDSFTLDDLRDADLTMTVEGTDGYILNGVSSMKLISRDPTDLVAQTIGGHHQYPDGFVLMTGTAFAPTKDRDAPGLGFTHHTGDVVSIHSPKFGTLVNRVGLANQIPPWTFGTGALMRNLAARGLL